MTKLLHLLEGIIALLLLAISIIVVTQVVLRYCFSSSITGANETITMLFIYMSAIGAAVAVGRREHITITMGTDTFPQWLRKLTEQAAILGVAIVNGAIVASSVGWIRVTGHYLMPTTELPRCVVQFAVPIGCGLAVLFCVSLLLNGLGKQRSVHE